MRTLILLVATLPLLVACGGSSTPGAGDLATYSGQRLVINYWAQWCKPCIKEIPELNEFNETHPDVQVLGVNYDGLLGEELAAQEEALGIEFPTLLQDPGAALGVPRPVVLPTTLIVDSSGKVLETLLGPQTLESLESALGN